MSEPTVHRWQSQDLLHGLCLAKPEPCGLCVERVAITRPVHQDAHGDSTEVPGPAGEDQMLPGIPADPDAALRSTIELSSRAFLLLLTPNTGESSCVTRGRDSKATYSVRACMCACVSACTCMCRSEDNL